MVDFTLPADLEDLRLRVKKFVADEIMPLEADPANFDDHEMIDEAVLAKVREKAKGEGLWHRKCQSIAGVWASTRSGWRCFMKRRQDHALVR